MTTMNLTKIGGIVKKGKKKGSYRKSRSKRTIK